MEATLEADFVGAPAIAEAAAGIEALSTQLDGRTLDVGIDLDAGAALAQLQAFQTAAGGIARDIKVDVDVDTAGAVAQVATASAAMQALRIGAVTAGQGLSAAMRVVPLLGGALSGMGQAAVSAGTQLAALGPAGLAVGAALTGLAAAAGVAAAGALGALIALIGPLVAGLTIAATAAAGLAAGLALIGGPLVLLVREIAEYNEGLEDQARLEKAAATAAEGLRDAEERLGDARGTLDDATRGLLTQQRNLNAALRDEPLNQREATLDLADARDRLSDATHEYNRAVRQYGRNSEEATDALRGMQRAEIELTRQERETNEIRKRGSEELRTARGQYRAAADERKSAARGVSRAEEEVADATREHADAVKAASTATGGLSREARSLRGAFERLKNSAPDDLLRDAKREAALLGVEVLGLAQRALPSLLRTSTNTTREMRLGFRDVADIAGGSAQNSLSNILADIPGLIRSGTRAVGLFSAGFLNFMDEALPNAADFLDSIEGTAERFFRWSDSKEGRREIREFLDSAAPVASALGDFLKEVGGELLLFGKEYGPVAADAIRVLTDMIKGMLDVLRPAVEMLGWLLRNQRESRESGVVSGGWNVRAYGGDVVPMAEGGILPGVPLYRASHGLNIPSHYVEDPTLMALGNANVLYGEALTPGHREYAFADGGSYRFITEEPGYDANSFDLWRDLGERKGYLGAQLGAGRSPDGGVGTQMRRRPPGTPLINRIQINEKVLVEVVTEIVNDNLSGGPAGLEEEYGL